jgi:hypothetical protein
MYYVKACAVRGFPNKQPKALCSYGCKVSVIGQRNPTEISLQLAGPGTPM